MSSRAAVCVIDGPVSHCEDVHGAALERCEGIAKRRDSGMAVLAQCRDSLRTSAQHCAPPLTASRHSRGSGTAVARQSSHRCARDRQTEPSTLHSDESALRIHVRPQWGARTVGSIRHSKVREWIASLASTKSPTTVRRAHGVLAAILDTAVRDRRIPSNPARDIKLPRRTQASRGYLSHRQVEALATSSKHPNFVRFLALTGLRWGEATGLRVKHLDVARRRANIEENAVWVNGTVRVGTPKTHERRTIVWPAVLDDAVKAAIAGRKKDALIWSDDGFQYRSPSNSQHGWFANAVQRCQERDDEFPRVTPHDLRHTAASLAISAGANVKAVQRMLGHRSAAMTLDRYAELFEDDLDAVAEAVSAAHARSNKTATES